MTLLISLLLSTVTLSTNVKDSSSRIKDSCKIQFINNLITHYSKFDGYWCVTNISNCSFNSIGLKSTPKKGMVKLKDIYDNFSGFIDKKDTLWYPKFLAYTIIENDGIGRCNPNNNGKYEQVLPVKYIDSVKINYLRKYTLNKFLHKFFDKDKQLKKKFSNYQDEIVWYCYEKNVIVFADGSGKCFYLEPNICKNGAL